MASASAAVVDVVIRVAGRFVFIAAAGLDVWPLMTRFCRALPSRRFSFVSSSFN